VFQTIIYIDRETPLGNILVFLTSVEEIEGMATMLDSYSEESKRKLKVLPLHAAISLEKQAEIFEFSRERKVVLATNIAESSITIPDIKYVIDCGFAKVKIYDPSTGADRLTTVPCGKASAIQRSGRAGRVTDGECYRIYTETGYMGMAERMVPEVLRVDLSSLLLKLVGLGVRDVLTFEMLDRPPESHLAQATDTLLAFGLVDEEFVLTAKGKRVAELGLDIKMGSVLVNSFEERFG
jgi:HrpA-like RNA helicase